MLLPRSALPRPLPSPQQLTLPFDGVPHPSSPPPSPMAEARRMSVRPRTIWRTLSPTQREQAQRTFRRVAMDVLREEMTNERVQ